MFGQDLLVKKFPYLAYSPNLMESFSIIGYNESFVPQILDSYKRKKNQFTPTILSSIVSDSEFGTADNKLTIGQIYPDNPLPILINKNDNNDEPPPTSNVIYSFCFDSSDGKKKIFYVCYGFKFYEKYKFLNQNNYEEYYIPKAFCIISQYYYFTLFEYICKNILTLMTQKENNSLPIELTVYNIVNFIPSPMNYRLHLDLFSYSLTVPEMDLGQLSGYPYLDFDLSETFKLLPLNLFLEIFFVTIIEQKILFFSSNLELLNMVMFIIYVLNYPCNDTLYFWHIVSVSKDNFVDENEFVGKTTPTLLGVNTAYSDELDTSAFGKSHFVVDIDNKKMIFKQADTLEGEEINDFDNLNDLYNYIQNIIKGKEKEKEKNIDYSFLKKIFGSLKKNLEHILSKNPEYTSNPKNKYVDFYKMSKNIMEVNKKIQEIFYDCSLNILMIFYQDNTLNSSFDKIKKDNIDESIKRYNRIRNIDINIQLNKQEKFFCKLFRENTKYKVYFENFIINLDSIDVYKIPFIFSEEFINIKMRDKSNYLMTKLSTFKMIDSLYLPKEQSTLNITLNNIYMDYLENLKIKFKCFFTPDQIKKAESRQLKVLNKRIINKYIYLLNNFYQKEELKDLFPSMRIQEKMEISSIDRRIICSIIQNNLEENALIELSDYLIYSLAYIFCISISLHSYNRMLKHINGLVKSLQKLKFLMRRYIYIIMKSFYRYYLIHKEKHIYKDINVSSIKMYYFLLVNCLKDALIIPNEEMMAILNLFFSKIIYRERESIGVKRVSKEIDNEIDFEIENGKNFLCFMKHCFTSKKTFKPLTMIKRGMIEKSICNIIITIGKRELHPTIQIKIKDYAYSSELFSPKKIYKLTKNAYHELFDKPEIDMKNLKIKNIRDTITNLIQYGLILNNINADFLPVDFLIYTLYLLKNIEQKSNK